MMYVEWYGVCDFVEICVAYGSVYVHHVFFCVLFMVVWFVLMYVV